MYEDHYEEGFYFETHSNNISDHFLIHLSVKSDEFCERGRSFWKLNNSVLLPNKKYLANLIDRYALRSESMLNHYNDFKSELRDTLRTMCIHKNRIDREAEEWLNEQKTQLLEKFNSNHQATFKDIIEYDQLCRLLCERQTKKNELLLKEFKAFASECHNGDPKSLKRSQKSIGPNKIEHITDSEGRTHRSNDKMLETFSKHFEKIYSNEEINQYKQKAILNKFFNDNQNFNCEGLGDEISSHEVKRAIRKLNTHSAPGPDGLTPSFYKIFEESLSELLSNLFNQAIRSENLPSSMQLAVIKLLPKVEKPDDPNDYRPISLLNTDLKILTHILAERAKIFAASVISKQQHAYLPGKQINIALKKISKAIERFANKQHSLVNVDFSKAFDSIDRNFIIQLLQKFQVHDFFVKSVRMLYKRTEAVIELNGHLSLPIILQRGVKQGCPLSAILFILSIEPLLQIIQNTVVLESKCSSRVEAYADDVTCIIKNESVGPLFRILYNYKEATQLTVNEFKTEVLSKDENVWSKTVSSTKILGTHFSLQRTTKSLLSLTKSTLSNHKSKINSCISLNGKSLAINTFVLPKLMHVARHQKTGLSILTKCQSELLHVIFPSSKYDIKQEILYQQKRNGGISLTYLPARVAAAKLVDTLWVNGENQTVHDSELMKLVKHCRGRLEHRDNFICLSHINDDANVLIINNSISLKRIYWFLIAAKFPVSIVHERLRKSSLEYGCSSTELIRFSERLWLNKNLFAFEKNALYRLAFKSIRDKQSKWNDGLEESPVCAFCDKEFETTKHILLECNFFSTIRNKIGLMNWKNIFVDKDLLKLRFVSSVLLGSLKNSPLETDTYLHLFLQM